MKPTALPIMVVAVTSHQTRIWNLLEDSHALPTVVDCPPGTSRNEHVIADRHHRAHGAFQFADAYFRAIYDALPHSAVLLLVGHGRGQGNMARGFQHYLHERRSEHDVHVHSLVNANIPAMTDAQIVARARAELAPTTAVS
jgi:hypothetical protein